MANLNEYILGNQTGPSGEILDNEIFAGAPAPTTAGPARRGNLNNLGGQVSTRTTSWMDMVIRTWGSEWAAPDHRVYVFSNGRGFDSTDRGNTGIYVGGNNIPAPGGLPARPAYITNPTGTLNNEVLM
jgi:hypothetical protein